MTGIPLRGGGTVDHTDATDAQLRYCLELARSGKGPWTQPAKVAEVIGIVEAELWMREAKATESHARNSLIAASVSAVSAVVSAGAAIAAIFFCS